MSGDQKRNLVRSVVVALLILVIVLMIADFNARMVALNRLTAEHAVVSTEYVSMLETQAALTAEVAYANSDEAVSRWAYENHLSRPGDVSVVVIGSGLATPTPFQKPQATPATTSNYKIWLDLFLEPPTP